MTDHATELRRLAQQRWAVVYEHELFFRSCADEIERLRRTLTRIWDLSEEYQYEGCGTLEKIGRIAKAALGTADQPPAVPTDSAAPTATTPTSRPPR